MAWVSDLGALWQAGATTVIGLSEMAGLLRRGALVGSMLDAAGWVSWARVAGWLMVADAGCLAGWAGLGCTGVDLVGLCWALGSLVVWAGWAGTASLRHHID